MTNIDPSCCDGPPCDMPCQSKSCPSSVTCLQSSEPCPGRDTTIIIAPVPVTGVRPDKSGKKSKKGSGKKSGNEDENKKGETKTGARGKGGKQETRDKAGKDGEKGGCMGCCGKKDKKEEVKPKKKSTDSKKPTKEQKK